MGELRGAFSSSHATRIFVVKETRPAYLDLDERSSGNDCATHPSDGTLKPAVGSSIAELRIAAHDLCTAQKAAQPQLRRAIVKHNCC